MKPSFAMCICSYLFVSCYYVLQNTFSKLWCYWNKPRKSSTIKIYHWTLNGPAAHDFIKISLIEAFISTHFDILCLSETFLHSTIDLKDEVINIDGYSIPRADHPSLNNPESLNNPFK